MPCFEEYAFADKTFLRSEIKIDWDFGSTAIWTHLDADMAGWYCDEYEDFPISSALVERMKYWCTWQEAYDPHFPCPDLNWDHVKAYGLSLAIDLKREFGDSYAIFYHDEEIELCPIVWTVYADVGFYDGTKH